ncbi:MAG: alkaline phosphatase family protein, partial [Actinomycetota bacterium]
MSLTNDGPSLLAIGIDSLETTYVHRLMNEGRMPNLARLAAEGRWASIGSVAHIGSGAVWPTFVSGKPPIEHGIANEWLWDPDTMSVRRADGAPLVPFWTELSSKGRRVGVLDVPFAPLIGMTEGFEVSEWGPHDVIAGRTESGPAEVTETVARSRPHPFSLHRVLSENNVTPELLQTFAEGAVEGIARRGELATRLIEQTYPDLAIIVFPEIHHMGHVMWHEVESGTPQLSEPPAWKVNITPSLADMLAAIDDQIHRLSQLVTDGGSVVIFSLHGMKAARGVPDALPPLLDGVGLAQPATWRSRTAREKVGDLFARAKRYSPRWLKDLYHRRADQMLQIRLARSTMLKQHDWKRTRVLAMPTDQHGLGRVNLRGRESDGIVPMDDFRSAIDEIEGHLHALSNARDEPLVQRVVRPVEDAAKAARTLPDFIVHWTLAAHEESVTTKPHDIEIFRVAEHRTGQHTGNAFCVGVGPVVDA